MSYTPAQAQAMSSSALDSAYDTAFKSNNDGDMAILGSEIAQRLASVYGFLSGAVGVDSFPLYEADLGVQSQNTSAQSAIVTSAKNVAGKISLWGGSTLLVVGLLAAVYLVWRFKK